MSRRRGPPRWLQVARQAKEGTFTKPEWVSRVLTRAGVLSASELPAALAAGRVKVAGRVASDPLTLVRPEEAVTLDGQPVPRTPPTLALMFHKPAGVVTAPTDPEGRGTVFERLLAVLPPELVRYGWHAVGRLDVDTTGLLLFSNDEKLVAHVTAPATHLPKVYLAKVQGTPTEERLEPLRQGVTLHDGPARPAQARLRDGQVELTLTEGRNHQVKRMLGAVGLPVTALHREQVGKLRLDVPEGAYRLLTEQELREALGYPAPGK